MASLLSENRMSAHSVRRTRKKAKGAPVIRLSNADYSYYFATQGARLDQIDGMTKTLQDDIRDVRTLQSNGTQYLNQRIDAVAHDLGVKLDHQTQTLTEHFDKGIASVTMAH